MTYKEALLNLDAPKWHAMDDNGKLGTLQAIENEMAARQQRTPCTVRGQAIQPDAHGNVTLGYYSSGMDQITINTEQLQKNAKYGNRIYEHVDTVIHEGRHAYQEQAVQGRIRHDPKETQAWAENMKPGHYISGNGRNMERYYNQPIEKDAFGYAKGMTEKVRKEQQVVQAQSKTQTQVQTQTQTQTQVQSKEHVLTPSALSQKTQQAPQPSQKESVQREATPSQTPSAHKESGRNETGPSHETGVSHEAGASHDKGASHEAGASQSAGRGSSRRR